MHLGATAKMLIQIVVCLNMIAGQNDTVEIRFLYWVMSLVAEAGPSRVSDLELLHKLSTVG
jgi:hypothetical protein